MVNEVYLILGASSDIARSYIEFCDKTNHKCTIIAQYHTSGIMLDDLEQQLKVVTLEKVHCDLSDEEDVQKLVSLVKAKYGAPTHILHMAASRLKYLKPKEVEWESVSRELEIQVHSIMEISKVFLPIMSKRKFGKVVFVLSSCTLNVPPKYTMEYTMVKYMLLGLMKSLASEYASKGININGISPNMVETRFLENIDERMVEMVAMNSPMKRNISIDGVIRTIDFLMGEGSEHINGVNFNITDGMIM